MMAQPTFRAAVLLCTAVIGWSGVAATGSERAGASDDLATSAPRTIVVRPIVGNPLASGQALRSAYASAPTASAEFPILLKLEPGTYDIGSEPLEMDTSFISLEGSGRDVSVVRGSGVYVILINASSHPRTRLSRLSVASQGGVGISVGSGDFELVEAKVSSEKDDPSSFAAAAIIGFSARGAMRDVILEATNPTGLAETLLVTSSGAPPEVFVADHLWVTATAGKHGRAMSIGTSAVITNSTISGSHLGLGVITAGASPPNVQVRDCDIRATANYALATISSGPSAITVADSVLLGGTGGIHLWSESSATVAVANSLVSGLVFVEGTNTLVCVGAYDESLTPLNNACQ